MYDNDDDEETMPGIGDAKFEWLDNIFVFNEFDDLIPLAGQMKEYEVKTSLYSFENKYYLHVLYNDEEMDDSRKTDLFSVLSEFGLPSNMTIHRIEEYGNLIMDSDVFATIQAIFWG